VPFAAQRTQAFTATSLPIGIGSASLDGTPPTLEIGGFEVFGTMSVNNGTGQSISGLQVRGWILQGSVRQPAGGSHDSFACAPGVCTAPARDIMIVASSNPSGLVCGSATAELDLEQFDGTLLDTFTIPVTLTQAGGCTPNTP